MFIIRRWLFLLVSILFSYFRFKVSKSIKVIYKKSSILDTMGQEINVLQLKTFEFVVTLHKEKWKTIFKSSCSLEDQTLTELTIP